MVPTGRAGVSCSPVRPRSSPGSSGRSGWRPRRSRCRSPGWRGAGGQWLITLTGQMSGALLLDLVDPVTRHYLTPMLVAGVAVTLAAALWAAWAAARPRPDLDPLAVDDSSF
jgi:hypothetical protein